MSAASEFASRAEAYIRWIDRVTTDEAPVNMRQLHELLALLQAAAARLPPGAPGKEDSREAAHERVSESNLREKLPTDAYSVVFNPFEYDPLEVNSPKPVIARLTDDLAARIVALALSVLRSLGAAFESRTVRDLAIFG